MGLLHFESASQREPYASESVSLVQLVDNQAVIPQSHEARKHEDRGRSNADEVPQLVLVASGRALARPDLDASTIGAASTRLSEFVVSNMNNARAVWWMVW